MKETILRPTTIEKIEPEDMEKKAPKKVKLKKKSKSWAKAALPGGEIPSTNPSLDVLMKGVKAIPFSAKPDTIIVPTSLPGLNRALKVGGLPTNCIMLVHGPSIGGKTAFGLAVARSFQLLGHIAVFIDAEHSLHPTLVEGCKVDADQLQYIAPLTYEDTTNRVEKIISNFREGRKKKTISENACLLFIVDSMTKLVPESKLKELAKTGKEYPLNALMNTAWLDKLTPIVGSLPILFMMFAHEKVKIDATMFEKKYTIKGGQALIYDSSVIIRMKEVGKKKRTVDGKPVVVGTIHEGVIEKSKLDISAEKFRFVMGKGRLGYPVGFDYCEEVIEEAKLRGDDSPIHRATGGKWTWRTGPNPDEYIAKSDAAFVDWLRENPDMVDTFITELNETAIDVVVEGDEEESEE